MSVVWLVLSSGLLVAFSAAALQQAATAFPVALALMFVVIGVGMLLAAVNMARRRAALAALGGELSIMTKGLLGTTTHSWPLNELRNIQVGPSGMELNNVPVLELQILSRQGKFGLLAGRDVAELQWMASELRAALWGEAEPESAF